jgi:CRP/FNR family cyclic AMP-dependent transcriptional regulator
MPPIMMSPNRQDTKDRLRAESEIQGLARKINLLADIIDDMEGLRRRPKTPSA